MSPPGQYTLVRLVAGDGGWVTIAKGHRIHAPVEIDAGRGDVRAMPAPGWPRDRCGSP